MTLDEAVELLTPYALAMRQQMDVPTFKAYAMILADVPKALGYYALEGIMATGPRFFPTAPEIRVEAEKVRRQQLALHGWEACVECERTPGWRETTDDRQVKRLERCPCKARHQTMLEARGLLKPVAALPGELSTVDDGAVYPTLEQLPAELRARIQATAAQKVLR